MDNYQLFRPEKGGSYSAEMSSIERKINDWLKEEASEGRCASFVRFFLSDAQNQEPLLRQALDSWSWPSPKGAGEIRPCVSTVEQPPLEL